MTEIRAEHFEPKGIRVELKRPTQMPAWSSRVAYVGRAKGSGVTEIVWVSETGQPRDFGAPDVAERNAAFQDAYLSAILLAFMDAGRAGETLDRLYLELPSDPHSRAAFGMEVVHALADASALLNAMAKSEMRVLRTRIPKGMRKADVDKIVSTSGATSVERNSAIVVRLNAGFTMDCQYEIPLTITLTKMGTVSDVQVGKRFATCV